jgi:acyl carrier protein
MTDAQTKIFSAIRKIKGPDSAFDLDSELTSLIRDSFDVFELQIAIEEAFDIELDNERFVEAKTIRDLLGLVSG